MFQFRNCSVAISPGSAPGLEQLMKLWSQYGLGPLYQKVTGNGCKNYLNSSLWQRSRDLPRMYYLCQTGKVETGCSSRYDLIWVFLQTGF